MALAFMIEHNNMLRVTSLLRFSYTFEGAIGNLRGVHNIIGTVVLVFVPRPLHAYACT